MNESISMIDYQTLLRKLTKEPNESHLLLGNGFNLSLGISTDYESIFTRMLSEESIYKEIEDQIKGQSYDIEKLIGLLQSCLKENEEYAEFLNGYIERKVKFDFMKSASSIVREKIKGIYQEQNEDLHLLFEKFTNYFTLNYDTFLYLLLMKFKNNEEAGNIAFQNTSLFQKKDLNQIQDNIYSEIQTLRKSGELNIKQDDNDTLINLSGTTKTAFETIVKEYSKKNEKKWKQYDIKRVCDKIWEEEGQNKKIEKINDGFEGDLFKEENNKNIFFIHGSFHIYESNGSIRKITQKQNKAMYEQLEEIIQANEKDLVCVLTSQSSEKERKINDNDYLKSCLEKLSALEGNIVILGSSLKENDNHIFNAINESGINKVYVASCHQSKNKNVRDPFSLFPRKEVILFDYTTISYAQNN